MTGALAGLTVVEMAAIGPVPLAGQLLADQGARVIVLDRKSGERDTSDVSRRNKQSVALNLKNPDGVAAAGRIIDRADILIEGFRPGVMEKLGLGPEQCHVSNPGLIFGRMTGWGQTGPLAQTAGHDLNYLAITGALHAIGRDGEPPIPPLNLVADYGGGAMFLLFGVLSALHERNQSGRGQVVDVAMSEGVSAMMSLFHSFSAKGRWQVGRERNLLDGGAPFYRCYETADGESISVGALEPQFFAELVQLAGIAASDCDTRDAPGNWPELHKRYEAVFKSKSRDQWVEIFNGSDACVAPVLSLDEVEAHPQNQARGTFIRQADVMQAAPAPRFDRTPAATPQLPLAPGESTEQVLQELGFDASQIASMRNDGALT